MKVITSDTILVAKELHFAGTMAPSDFESLVCPVWLEVGAVGGHGYRGAVRVFVTHQVVEEFNHGVVCSLVEGRR